MRAARELELGAMFWATTTPVETLQAIKGTGVTCGQLGFDGGIELSDDLAAQWKAALEAEDFPIVTCFCAYNGEEYPDIPTVVDTVGFIPKRFREERMARTRAVSDFAAKLGVGAIGLHIGCVPSDDTDPDYLAVLGMVREIADHAASHGQVFALETGQEPAAELRHFLTDVRRTNVKINFDPANMILYGMGDPVEAVKKLAPRIAQFHIKDAIPTRTPGQWGEEVVAGTGAVRWPDFFAAAASITGDFIIEREAGNNRITDVIAARRLVETYV